MSRKQMVIDWPVVNEMFIAQCSGAEVAYSLGFKCPDTLYKRVEKKYKIPFSEYMRQQRTSGQAKLRSTQFKSAVNDKDRVMQIWLGKQYLGQKDKTETEISLPGLINDLQLHLNIVAGIKVPDSEPILNDTQNEHPEEIMVDTEPESETTDNDTTDNNGTDEQHRSTSS